MVGTGVVFDSFVNIGTVGVVAAVAAHPAYDRAVSAPGVSAIVGGLSTDPARALYQFELTGLRGSELFGYVTQLQTVATGWTSHAHWRARELDDPMPLVELVTLRCASTC